MRALNIAEKMVRKSRRSITTTNSPELWLVLLNSNPFSNHILVDLILHWRYVTHLSIKNHSYLSQETQLNNERCGQPRNWVKPQQWFSCTWVWFFEHPERYFFYYTWSRYFWIRAHTNIRPISGHIVTCMYERVTINKNVVCNY